jgi:hypothetical protein
MPEPTLTDVFGGYATQTATHFTIRKSDLPGLSEASDNRAESLLAAILVKAKGHLTTANQETNPDQSITVVEAYESFAYRNNKTYNSKSLTVNLQAESTNTAIDPMAY